MTEKLSKRFQSNEDTEQQIETKCTCNIKSCNKKIQIFYDKTKDWFEILISDKTGIYPQNSGIILDKKEFLKIVEMIK